MRVKTVVEEDFTNYKIPSMFIGTVSCDGKCCKEAGIPLSVCQNDGWRSCKVINIANFELISRYLRNPITSAIVIGGLEPFEQFHEMRDFIRDFRDYSEDMIVIYTGYYRHEILEQVEALSKYGNIIIKFGRFVPDCGKKYDEVLGVTLASDNQYAERIC